ncbi:MAG TPA: tetratricopeptide repeat protein, partial [Candidatus Acidoferrum sp.]|nr:tetratricopeptide repeat protein [Candidatus Acidoferrum sp.]
LANALAAYGSYLGKFFWPVNLSIFYPFTGVHAAAVLISAVLLAGVSAFCLWQARSRPCLLVGWCWFAVMLLPVIGLLQVGRQSLADRYTYLPSIGLSLLSVWGVAGWTAAGRFARAWLIAAAAAMLLGCFLDTRHQLRYWRDSITLLGHSLEVTPAKNCVGHWALGNAYLESGNLGAAVEHYHAALVIAPNFQEVHYQLGGVLLRQKKYAEAEAEFAEALRLNDHDFNAHLGLGHALVHQEKYAEAQAEYARALALKPDNAAAKQALVGATLKAEGEKALANFYDTLKVQPTPEIQVQIAAILTIQGKFQEAKEHYLAALQLKPDSPDVLNNLAWLLTTCPDPQVRDGAQAVRYAERACALTQSRETTLVGTLAAAYAEAGRFEDAVKTAGKACALASASGQPELLQKNQELLELYRRQQTYREMDNTNSIRAGSLK